MTENTPAAEHWLPVPGHDGLYEASNLGRVRSYVRSFKQPETPHILAGYINTAGYRVVQIAGRVTYVHQLVALAFLGERPTDRSEVRHLDGNPSHNALSNLAYGTHLQNMDDMRRHGTHGNTQKTHCAKGHEFSPENTVARAGRTRTCLTCERTRSREYQRRRRLAQQTQEASA